jgi:pyrophosphatase PpaX
MVTAYPGVVGMIRAIRRAGHRTGIVTSKNRTGAVRGLRRIGLEEDIEIIIGADDVTRPKPHPEPILTALQRLGEQAESTIYIGDSTHDMESGRSAGVATGAVLWGPFQRDHLESTQPTHWLDHPDDVLRLLNLPPGA